MDGRWRLCECGLRARWVSADVAERVCMESVRRECAGSVCIRTAARVRWRRPTGEDAASGARRVRMRGVKEGCWGMWMEGGDGGRGCREWIEEG